MYIVSVDTNTNTPIKKNNNFGLTALPKQKLAMNAPIIDPTEKDDLKIGFKILFVFDSIIATWVKTLGAWKPMAIPHKLWKKIKK